MLKSDNNLLVSESRVTNIISEIELAEIYPDFENWHSKLKSVLQQF